MNGNHCYLDIIFVVVQKLGYELIYADTDSVFIKNSNEIATTDE